MDSKGNKVNAGAGFGSTNGPFPHFDVEDYTFSMDNPRFAIIISKKNTRKVPTLHIPANMHKHLPNLKVPTMIKCYGKMWDVKYSGDRECKAFNPKGWGKFIIDNDLQIGDAVFFELLEATERNILFKAIIMKSHLNDGPSQPTS